MRRKFVCDTINGIIDKTIVQKVQKLSGKEKIAPKPEKENTYIDWNQPIGSLNEKIKGLAAYTEARTRVIEE